MGYLKEYKQHLKSRAEALTADILAIEGDLRAPVAYLVESLAQNAGNFWARSHVEGKSGIGKGLSIYHLDLDDDVMDAFENRFGEELVEQSAAWILERLKDESAIFVSWAIGPILFEEGNHRSALENRVLFNLNTRKFEAVLSHENFRDPKCVHYLMEGGTRKAPKPKKVRKVRLTLPSRA